MGCWRRCEGGKARPWLFVVRPVSERRPFCTTPPGKPVGFGSSNSPVWRLRWNCRSRVCTSCAWRWSATFQYCPGPSRMPCGWRSASRSEMHPIPSWWASGRLVCCPRLRPSGRSCASWTTPSGSTRPPARCWASWPDACWRSRSGSSSGCVNRTDERELVRLPELLLTGLSEEDAGALLAATIPGRLDQPVRDRIIGETRGNPLALLELSRAITAAQLAGGFALPTEADLPAQIEDHYLGRARALPEPTQHLMLLAAADPVGDAALLWRAAQSLGIEPWAAEPAEADQLLEIGSVVRFRHPLVRSAVYRAASTEDRRAAHAALAAATDPEADPDRRAWHRAHAANGPDEEVAGELLHRANDAERRGGIAAAAAFMEWAVMLTPAVGARASRALAAAGAKFQAGDFAAAESLLATADAGPLDDLGRAQVERMRAQIAFDLRRGSDAPALLLHAAQRLESLDAELARETYLEATGRRDLRRSTGQRHEAG